MAIYNKEQEATRKFFFGMQQAAPEMYKTIKKRALKKNLEFDFTKESLRDLLIESQGCCAITNIRFEYNSNKGVKRPWYPSIDRINSKKGYIKDNCRVVCVAVNLAMNEWGESVLIRIASAMRGNE